MTKELQHPAAFKPIKRLPHKLSSPYYMSRLRRALGKDLLSKERDLGLARRHMLQNFSIYNQLKNINFVPSLEFQQRNSQIIIAFDLDETLIHSARKLASPHFTLTLPLSRLQLHVNIRPHAKQVLQRLSKTFRVVIYTASKREYSEEMVKLLDPTGDVISGVYCREDCFKVGQFYIKSLQKNFPINKIILVDNQLSSYFTNPRNGVPIIPYFDNPFDSELLDLEQFLMELRDEEDVRNRLQQWTSREWLYEGGCLKQLEQKVKALKNQ